MEENAMDIVMEHADDSKPKIKELKEEIKKVQARFEN